jgi:hypothetical protein
MEWFKVYQDGILRGSLSMVDNTIQLIWLKFLAIENETHYRDGWLHFAEGKPMSREYLASVCQVTVLELNKAIECFIGDKDRVGHSRIEIKEDGDIYIKNWDKYQSKPDKIIARDVSIDKARQAKRQKEANIEALTKEVNRLNSIKESENRYKLTEDNNILDTKTGEIFKAEGEQKDEHTI